MHASLEPRLRYETPAGWFEAATADLGALLSDHLHAERKAAENALMLMRKYPHDRNFVEALARLAHEETSHIIQVSTLMASLGLPPRSDTRNPYTRALFDEVRQDEPGRRTDFLLVAALIEARSHERLCLLADGFRRAPRPELAQLYDALSNAEARHAQIFIELAARINSRDAVAARLNALAEREAEVVARLPLGTRVH